MNALGEFEETQGLEKFSNFGQLLNGERRALVDKAVILLDTLPQSPIHSVLAPFNA